LYKTAVHHWGLQPSEFWAMTPQEFWHLFEIKHGRSSMRYGTMTESEVESLYNLLEKAK
jgi:hypothetical protein